MVAMDAVKRSTTQSLASLREPAVSLTIHIATPGYLLNGLVLADSASYGTGDEVATAIATALATAIEDSQAPSTFFFRLSLNASNWRCVFRPIE